MNLKSELKWLVLIALVTVGVFANSLGGEFVYDDRRQVVANALIQTPSLYGKALTNDVWAFKGDGTVSASNYWRPTFTAWCVINFRLFGLEPFGWHLLNILLQMGVCLLAYLLLRRWGLSQILAFSITLVFAAHPVHTESVTWIAGSPDLLFGLFFLGSLWFAESVADKDKKKRRPLNMALAVLCYILALGAKEVAFLCFPIYYFIFSGNGDGGRTKVSKSARFNRLGIFAATAAAYFVVRWMILGRLSRPAEGAASIFSAILSAPSVFVFYLRQLVFPYWVGINYPLRPVEQVDAMNFFIPLVIAGIAVAALWLLAKRSPIQRLGLALFILPLLTVFNIPAFPPEQIVHDRYLYLPLLGFLIVVFPYLKELFEKAFSDRAEKLLPVFAVAISVPLAVQTFLYNRVWRDELSLWRHAVTIDAGSAANWAALASGLSEKGQTVEAIKAFDTSISIRPATIAYIGRAQSLIKNGNPTNAVKDMETVIATDPRNIDLYSLYLAYEALAVAHQQNKSPDKAEAVLTDARNRLPIYRAALTEKLAIVLYQQNRKPEALKELENVKGQARVELLPASKAVFLRLGMLYAELGRNDEAKANLREFLAVTATAQDKETPENRQQAEQLLKQLK